MDIEGQDKYENIEAKMNKHIAPVVPTRTSVVTKSAPEPTNAKTPRESTTTKTHPSPSKRPSRVKKR